MNYLQLMQVQLGIPMWLLITIIAWSVIWKLLALWKSARKNHVAWFIIIFFVITIGILEILYLYVFSEIKCERKKTKKKTVKKVSKKKSKRK